MNYNVLLNKVLFIIDLCYLHLCLFIATSKRVKVSAVQQKCKGFTPASSVSETGSQGKNLHIAVASWTEIYR